MTIELSPSQIEARDKVIEWYEAGANGIFRLFGYAGTGKTTTIGGTIEELSRRRDEKPKLGDVQEGGYITELSDLKPPMNVRYATFTGKAAMVMVRHGLPATTIHSMIYKLVPPDKQKLRKLASELKAEDDKTAKNKIRKELEEAEQPKFELKTLEESGLDSTDLIVLDECSMLNDPMVKDIQSYDVPILVLGDPGQLPPIKGASSLINGAPHALLTEIHRQAEDDPIIAYATRARNQIFIPYGAMGESKHVEKHELTTKEVLAADQILVGKNATRRDWNQQIRAALGRGGDYPVVGEKLICLRNDREKGLFNGMMCEVVRIGDELDFSLELDIRTELQVMEDYTPIKIKALKAHFDIYHDKDIFDSVRTWMYRDVQEFDYGYAITVHKSQGSQWDNVILVDDKFLSWKKAERAKWLYTAITRAAERITIGD